MWVAMSIVHYCLVSSSLYWHVAYGFSEFWQYFIWYATFKAGGDFVQSGECSFRYIMQSPVGLLFAAVNLGNVSVFHPHVSDCNLTATQVYRILDRKGSIDSAFNGDQDERIAKASQR